MNSWLRNTSNTPIDENTVDAGHNKPSANYLKPRRRACLTIQGFSEPQSMRGKCGNHNNQRQDIAKAHQLATIMRTREGEGDDALDVHVDKAQELPLPVPAQLFLSLLLDLSFDFVFPSKEFDHTDDVHS